MVIFCLLNYAYKKTKHYDLTCGQTRKFKNIPDDLKIVNSGSNHALYGLNYDGIGLKSFNFALSPQYLLYDLKILKSYGSHIAKNGVVLITLPPCIFCFDGDERCDLKYYRILPGAMIPRFSWARKVTKVVFPLLSNPTAVRFLIKDICVTLSHSTADNSKTRCEKEALARRDGWVRQFNLKDMETDDLPPTVKQQFEKTVALVSEMIDFCLNRELCPVLVVPPVSEPLRKLLGVGYLKTAFYDNINRANAKKVPLLDYLGDEQFADYSLYRNSDFLTENGSKLFTKKVVSDLQSINYLPSNILLR